jgi:hypothetical protein
MKEDIMTGVEAKHRKTSTQAKWEKGQEIK